MKRPIFIVTIAFISGILFGIYLFKFIFAIFIALFLILLLKIKYINEEKINKYINIILLYFIIVSISVTCTYVRNIKFENKYKKYDGNEIQIVGTIISSVNEKDYKYVCTLKIESINGLKKYKGEYLLLNLKKANNKKINYGDKICLKGNYEEPSKSRNYKGFNYKNYLKSQNIYGIINADNISKVIKQKNINFFDRLSNLFIEKIKRNLDSLLSKRTAPLAMGILLGYVDDIDEDIKEAFKDSNLTHMLAISGENTVYVMLILNFILSKKIVGNRWQKRLTIIIMIAFMKVTGMTLSVVRAGITCIVYMIASLFHRKADVINTISIASIITLIKNPFNIFNAGMQLSYAGTISIILFYDIFEKKITTNNKILKYILESMAVTLSANVFIIPIMAYQFNTVSLTFLLSNLVASPVIGIATIFGVVTSVLSIISLDLAKVAAIILQFSLVLIISIAKFFAKISISKLVITTPSLFNIIIIYIIEIVAVYLFKYSNITLNDLKSKYKNKILNLLAIILIVTICSKIIIIIPKISQLTVHFIDVGQGDSCLIESPSNKKILIDSGGSITPNIFDVGEKTLLPYLLDRGINNLDYVMISHFDADHCQGLEAVINNIKIKNIIISKQSVICDEYSKIIDMCKKRRVNIIIAKRGEKIVIDKFIMFNIFNPSDKFIDDGKGGLNANAIVAQLQYKQKNNCFTILFTGDIEEKTEEELVNLYGNKLKSDILKVSHHGSKTSSTSKFINDVKPKISLIGVGKKNKFGHPNSEVLDRINNINSKIYRTDLCGEITIKIRNNIKIETIL